jgi:hypothetical protein
MLDWFDDPEQRRRTGSILNRVRPPALARCIFFQPPRRTARPHLREPSCLRPDPAHRGRRSSGTPSISTAPSGILRASGVGCWTDSMSRHWVGSTSASPATICGAEMDKTRAVQAIRLHRTVGMPLYVFEHPSHRSPSKPLRRRVQVQALALRVDGFGRDTTSSYRHPGSGLSVYAFGAPAATSVATGRSATGWTGIPSLAEVQNGGDLLASSDCSTPSGVSNRSSHPGASRF